MRAQLERRLQELRVEYAAGQKMLAELETQHMTLRETLLRISGAMQVLEEELSKSDPVVQNGQQSEDVALHIQC